MLKIKPKKVKKLEEHNFIQKKVNRNLPTARQNFESFYIDGQALRAPVECQMEAHQHFWHWTSFSSHHLFHRCLLQLQKLKKRLFFPVVLKQRTCCYDASSLLLAVRLPFGPKGNELGGPQKLIIMRKNVVLRKNGQ